MSIGAGPADVVDVVDFRVSARVFTSRAKESPEMEDTEVEESEYEDSELEESEYENSEFEKSEEPGQRHGRRNDV
jgi:hypothetical protein